MKVQSAFRFVICSFVCFLTQVLSAAQQEVWVKWGATTGGSGTMADPKVVATSSAFDGYMNGQPTDTTIHLLSGTFLTRSFFIRAGQKIRGAGMDSTIVKLEAGSTDGGVPCIYGDPNALQDNAEISDMTINCNLQEQLAGANPGAIFMSGSNTRVSRIKAINWGSTGAYPYRECFVIFCGYNKTYHNMAGQGGQLVTNCIIEDVLITQPAPVDHTDGTTAIAIIGHPPEALANYPANGPGFSTPGPGWVKGGVIRNCRVIGVHEGETGTAAGEPYYFHGFTAGFGTDSLRLHDNYVIDVVGVAVYDEEAYFRNLIIEDNLFLDVKYGYYMASVSGADVSSYLRDGLTFRGNNVVLRTDVAKAIGFTMDVEAVAPKVKNVRIERNTFRNNIGTPATTDRRSISLSHWDGQFNGSVENIAIDNNTLDVASGSEWEVTLYWADRTRITSFEDNRKENGNDVPYVGSPADGTTIVFFTPTQTGWYRVGDWCNGVSGVLAIDSDYVTTAAGNHLTSLEFSYDIPWLANSGTVTLNRFFNYGSTVTKVRTSSTPYTPPDCKHVYLDIFVESVEQVNQPTPWRLRFSNSSQGVKPLPTPSFVGTIDPLPSPTDAQVTLNLGTGFRTSRAIYAGNTQVTDETGKVRTEALNVVDASHGGLGQNASAQPANRFPYTTATGTFGFGTLTSFTLGLLDDQDAATAQGTLQLVPGTHVQPYNSALNAIAGLSPSAGNLMAGNGSTWTSVAISQDGSLASSGALTVNKLSPSASAIQGFNSAILSGTLTLTASDARIQHLKTTSAASQVVKLPNVAAGREFLIHNIGVRGANTNLVVQNSGGVEQFQLAPGSFTIAESKGSDTWEFQTFGKNQPFTLTVGEVDAKTVANTPMLTVPLGLNFVTTALTVETTTLTGSPSLNPQISLGTSSSPESIVAAANISNPGGIAVNTFRQYLPKSHAATLTNATLNFKVVTASGATTHKLTVHVTGFYR
jgi:hypothetical protein